MQKSGLALLISGILIVLGLVLLVIGNQIILEGVSQGNGVISSGQPLIVSVDFNDDKNIGVFAVQITNVKENIFSAQILDPYDNEIAYQPINEETIEKEFDITSGGTYKLIIESTSMEKTQTFGAIGPLPDAGKKSLGFISLYVLVVGMAGLIISGIFAVKKRKSV